MHRTKQDRDQERGSRPASRRTLEQRASGPDRGSGRLANLHRSVGNQAIKKAHERGELQAKLKVSKPGDEAERRAEQAADEVLEITDPAVQDPPDIQRSASPSGSLSVDPDRERHIRSLKGGGKPLSPSERSFFEPRFGSDFSNVRVHSGPDADRAARSINAEAFTHGNDIVFRGGAYDPGTDRGKKLIAHELTHVVQQGVASENRQTQRYRTRTMRSGASTSGTTNSTRDASSGRGTNNQVSRSIGSETAPSIDSAGSSERIYRRWDERTFYGVGDSRAEQRGLQSNPDDPWVTLTSVNYVEAAPVAPMQELPRIEFSEFPRPLNAVDRDGDESELPLASTFNTAKSAIESLEQVAGTVRETYDRTEDDGDEISRYNNAQDDAEFGPHTGGEGLNWQVESAEPGTDVGALAEQQTPHEGSVSVGELFSETGGLRGEGQLTSAPEGGEARIREETLSAAQTEDVSGMLGDARGKKGDLQNAIHDYQDHIITTIPNALDELKNKYSQLEINEAEQDIERAQMQKDRLERSKQQALSIINGLGEGVDQASSLITGDLEDKVETGSMALTTLAGRVVDLHYRDQMRNYEGTISRARMEISELEDSIDQRELDRAQRSLTSEIERSSVLEGAVHSAMYEYQRAYDSAARRAGETAEGVSAEQSNRLRTALAAIPRIEKVIDRNDRVLQQIEIPTYDQEAGLAFAVAHHSNRGMDTQLFLNHIGSIKYRNLKFMIEQYKWQQRLAAVKEVERELNVEGT